MEFELIDWTKEEKLMLFQALKYHGSYDIKTIQSSIPTKTEAAIEDAITYFKVKAMKQEDHSNVVKESSRQASIQTYVPLNQWAKLLTETFPFNELRTETATALRLIADYEDIPAAVCTEKIDFKKVYHTLANALEGKALCEDKLVAEVINKCVVETALTSKAFMRCTSSKTALKDIKINLEQDLRPFIKPTDNNEVAILRQIAMQKNYNPLSIPEQHLKFSYFT